MARRLLHHLAVAPRRALHADLTAMVARLERRLDRQPPVPVDPGR
jgi:hypothetical protein